MPNVTNLQVGTNYARILDALSRNKAMSVIELMSDFAIPDSEITDIVKKLKDQDLIFVSGEGLDQIVTVKESRLRAVGD